MSSRSPRGSRGNRKRSSRSSRSRSRSRPRKKQEVKIPEVLPIYEMEEKEFIPLTSRKSSSPKTPPSIDVKTFFGELPDVEQKMIEDPEWIPFWKNVKKVEKRRQSWLPETLYNWWYQTGEVESIQGEYLNKLRDSVINFTVTRKYPNAHIFLPRVSYTYNYDTKEFEFLTLLFTNSLIEFFKKSIEKRKEISIIRLHLSQKSSRGGSGHQQVLMFNHIHKTIEFYDPQFFFPDLFSEAVKNYVFEILKKGNIMLDYNWQGLGNTCPNMNIQYFEDLGFIPETVRANGFCVFWTLFMIEIRVVYARYSAKTIKRILHKLIRKMKGDIDFQNDRVFNPFAKFIYEYVLYLEQQYSEYLGENQ